MHFRWMMFLTIKAERMKHSEENSGKHRNSGFGKVFIDRDQNTPTIKINQLGFITIKIPAHQKTLFENK